MPAPKGTFFEFGSADDLIAAVDAARAMGLGPLETYTPYAIPELDEKLGLRRSRIPMAVFVFGALGCAVAYWIIWFCNASDYRLDVGGRPYDSLPADIPIMFETTVLFAGTASFLAVLFLSGMPRLHHPVHEIEGSEGITIDRFWLAVEETARVDESVRARMMDLGALAVRTAGGAS